MSADPNKKSGRSFQCRDVLWETFEQMARELECSVDYLVNEAMKQYARQRSYGGASRTPLPAPRGDTGAMPIAANPGYGGGLPPPPVTAPGMGQGAGASQQMRSSTAGPTSQRLPPPPVRTTTLPATPPPMRTMQPVAAQPVAAAPAPAPQQRASTAGHTVPHASVPQARNAPPPPPPSRVPPPMRPQTAPTPMHTGLPTNNGYAAPPPNPSAHGGMLSVFYQGEKLPVTKDRFVIGRGKQSSDLTLKDPNVSRQHAMVEFQNGVYFMVDMGSTNGVEYNGQRIARKQIGEGDSFRICDHEMRFTYR
jgi:hypothetical protein